MHRFIVVLLLTVGLQLVHTDVHSQSVVDVQEVMNIFNKINESGNITTKFDPESAVKFPVGIVKEIGGKPYVAAITNSEIQPNKALLDVYFQFFFPGSSKPLAFGANGVAFNSKGLELSSGIKLALLSDVSPIENDKFKLTFKANGGTYAQFGCGGIERIHIAGTVEFNASFATQADGVSPLAAQFEFDVVDANNILLDISLSPFQVKAMKGFVFSCEHATLDLSDYENPQVEFPTGYIADGIASELWRGVACSSVKVTFPKELAPSGGELSVEMKNLIIDEDGVTAEVKAKNVKGGEESTSQTGWPLTVEGVDVVLLRNKLVGAGFLGKLKVPYLGDDPLAYEATIKYDANGQRNYRIWLELPAGKTFDFKCLSAKLLLHEHSSIEVTYFNGKLTPKAVLNGEMSIDHKPIVLGVGFEDLELSPDKVSISRFYLLDTISTGKIAGFELAVNRLDASNLGDDIKIDLNATVSLSVGSGFDIAGCGDVSIRAGKKESGNYGISKVNVNTIALALNTSALEFKGMISISQDDPEFGDGFGGEIDCSIAGVLKGIKIGIRFGRVNGFSYWYTGGEVALTVQVGPVTISSFKGALYYHMKEKAVSYGQLSMSNFTPDKEVSVGIKAGVGLGVVEIVKGDVMILLEFTSSGGVRKFGFDGSVYLLNASEDAKSFKFQANFQMYYDFSKKEFFAQNEVFINVFNVIKGIGDNCSAGKITVLSNPSTWFIKIGTPSERIGLKAFGMLETGSYFIAGDVPDVKFTLPETCRKLIGDYKAPDLGSLKSSKCFGFGANLQLKAGGKVGPFYASIELGGGFDLLLKKVNCRCEGQSSAVGIGGWYSLGQAYFYMDGSVGVRCRGRNFDIMSVGLAALLQAELPNPYWIKGTLAGRYKILGGLVRGKFKVSFEAGDRCEFVQDHSELADIQVIGDLSPKDGTKNVDVFAAPQVAFNTAINKEFKLEGEGSKTKSYRVLLEKFKATGPGGVELVGEQKWNSEGDVLVLDTPAILPENSEIKVDVKVKWQYKEGSGDWTDSEFEGKADVEEKSLTFTTGPAPDYISPANVSYTYPIESQANFYRDEYNKGYIKMKKTGVEYLFKTEEKGVKWDLVARYNTNNGIINVPFNYEASNNEVSFMIPAQLSLGQIYELRLLKIPSVVKGIDSNVKAGEKTAYTDNSSSNEDGNEALTATRESEGEVNLDEAKELYAINFRTSKYSTMADKVAKFDNMKSYFSSSNTPYKTPYLKGTIDEGFDDQLEMGSEGLIKIAAQNDNNLWFNTHIKEALYSNSCYKWGTDNSGKGIPPIYSIDLWQENPQTFESKESTRITMTYGFPREVYSDYSKLRNWYFSKMIESGNRANCSALEKLLNMTPFPNIAFGDYDVRFYYTLPGRTEPTSSADTKIIY